MLKYQYLKSCLTLRRHCNSESLPSITNKAVNQYIVDQTHKPYNNLHVYLLWILSVWSIFLVSRRSVSWSVSSWFIFSMFTLMVINETVCYSWNILLHLTLCLLVSSADNLCKQCRPNQAWSGSKLFDTLIAFLKEHFEKQLILTKINRRLKSMSNYITQ